MCACATVKSVSAVYESNMQWQFYVRTLVTAIPVPAVKTRMLAAVYVATNTCSTVTYGIFNLAWAGLKTFRISLLDRQIALSAPAVPYLPGSEPTCKRFARLDFLWCVEVCFELTQVQVGDVTHFGRWIVQVAQLVRGLSAAIAVVMASLSATVHATAVAWMFPSVLISKKLFFSVSSGFVILSSDCS